MRMCECDRRTSTAERVGEGSSPRIRASPVSIRLKRLRGVDAERLEHLGREHLAHAALEREAAVGAARPRGRAAALGAEIEQAAAAELVHLREQEAAAVAELGIVGAELVAVIAQRQRRLEAAGQRREAAEMVDPFRIGQGVETDAGGGALIAEAQDVLGKFGRCDLVIEGAAERGMADGGTKIGGKRHAWTPAGA